MIRTKLAVLLVVAAVAAVCVPADALSVNVLKGEVHHDDGRLTEGGADKKKSSLDVTPLLAGMFGGDVGGMAMASAQQASAIKASSDHDDDDDDDDAVPEVVDEATGTVLSLEERAAKEQAEDAAADMADVMGEDVTAADDPDHRMEARASAACEKHKAAAEAAAPAGHAAGGPATNETHVLVMEDEASAALAASAAAPAGAPATTGGNKEPPRIDASKVAHHFEKAVEREEREQGAAPMPVTEPKTLDDELLRGVVHGVGDNAPPDTAPVLDASTVKRNKNAEPPAAPTRMPKEGVKAGPDESAEELKRRDAKEAQEQHKKAETFHVAGDVVEESHRNLKNAAKNLGANE